MTAPGAGTALFADERAQARFEFRSFAQDLDAVRRRLEALTVPLPDAIRERQSSEVYVVSRASDVHSVKVRGGKLDIKTWVTTVDGLEQWHPLAKFAFPLGAAVLHDEVFPALGVAPPALPDAEYDLERFLALARAHPALVVVRVQKRRFAYLVHGTICEYAEVLVNGARVVTVSIESTDLAAIRQAMEATGMAGLENINYLQAIKRVIGLSATPLPT